MQEGKFLCTRTAPLTSLMWVGTYITKCYRHETQFLYPLHVVEDLLFEFY